MDLYLYIYNSLIMFLTVSLIIHAIACYILRVRRISEIL